MRVPCRSTAAAALVALVLAVLPLRAARATERGFLRRPKLGWVLYSAAWVGASIWAQQSQEDFPRGVFSYVPATYTGLYLGATAGGYAGDSAAPGNWGPALAGMLIGGLLGAGAGVGLGYAAQHNTPTYYATQAAYVSVVMFTVPLF